MLKDNINVGDYVRTIEGYICKILEIHEEYDDEYLDWNDIHSASIKKSHIIKLSPDIIDLIEVGDLLFVDVDNDYKGGIIVPRISETQNELDLMIGFIKNGNWILKGIVTREQIEDMEYKIER